MPDNAGDSWHIGLNGTTVATGEFMIPNSGLTNPWVWSRVRNGGSNVTVSIPSTGIHTLNLWMREDGARIDRILLTTDINFIPSGNGPAESPRSSGGVDVLAEGPAKDLHRPSYAALHQTTPAPGQTGRVLVLRRSAHDRRAHDHAEQLVYGALTEITVVGRWS